MHSDSGTVEGKIIPFTAVKLDECKKVRSIRQENNLKHKDVQLPDLANGHTGYHLECYRRFTALSNKHRKQKGEDEPCSSRTIQRAKRQINNNIVFPEKCLFCNTVVKQINNVRHQLTRVELKDCDPSTPFFFQKNLLEYAEILEDREMIAKVQGIDLIARRAHYHRICRTMYQEEAKEKLRKEKRKKETTNWHHIRAAHAEAFTTVCDFVQETIIGARQAYHISELCDLYQSNLSEISEEDTDNMEKIRPGRLSEKIKEEFKESIRVSKISERKGTIVHHYQQSVTEALDTISEDERRQEDKIKEAAFILRNSIRKCRKRSLPDDMKVEDVLQGEVDTPEIVEKFFSHLITGPRSGRGETQRKRRRIDCLSQDSVFAVTDGRFKPKKHLKLGLAMKKLGGSRKITNILSRCGYIPSYNATEEIETELAYNCQDEADLTPFGMDRTSEKRYSIGLAFDNYDKKVETLNGKDTLHDTVGIAYQDITNCTESSNAQQVSNNTEPETNRTYRTIGLKRRRSYEIFEKELEPYYKKPKMTSTISITTFDQTTEPEDFSRVKFQDMLWLLSVYLNQKQPVMWTGWNSTQISVPKAGSQQKVWYLQQINQSPTSKTVVVETLNRALKIAKECNLQTIPVTFDLAIAKVAYQIQATESPKYDNIFINLGAFHIELAFFNAIGKYIKESGGPFILTESGVLASGSLNQFLKGKHYNRCKRIHMLFAAAIEILRLDEFVNEDGDNIISMFALREEINQINQHDFNINSLSDDLKKFLKSVERNKNDICDGASGATAKYWMGYVDMVMTWLEFSRSIREGDLDLYIFSVKNISKYFFALNQPNYSRWMTEYHSKLVHLKKTHPDVEKQFRSGAFGVRRSNKNFSRVPIDLTLEQTINADAASEKTGIVRTTNSISARQRWAKSHSVSMTVLSSLLEDLGLTSKEDVSRELKPCRIRSNANDLNKILTLLRETINPFSKELDKNDLFNIGSGKAASKETKEFLLSLQTIGEKAQAKFVAECTADKARFEDQPIKQEKMSTFANEGVKRKIKSDGKFKEVKMERDLFGKILCLALEHELDMEELFKYPLTAVPLSLCHFDGTLRKTPKSKLSKELRDPVPDSHPNSVDVYLIDGNFYLHLLCDVPHHFGGVARSLLAKICALRTSEVHLVFDQIQNPSIKDYERDSRAGELDRTLNYQIVGDSQRRPADFRNALRNDAFKDSFIGFLVTSWNDNSLASMIGNKTIFITHRSSCFRFTAVEGKVVREEEQTLYSTHEEADTRLFFHLASLPEVQSTERNVVIRSNDTDVLVIALGQASVIKDNVWLEIGYASDNSLEYVNINQLIDHFGMTLCRSLPAFHAITGCDPIPALSGRGKVKPFKWLMKSVEYQQAFIDLGMYGESEGVISAIEEFVCKLYGSKRKTESVDELRLKKFYDAYKPKSTKKKAILSAKEVSALSLPPCSVVLLQQIRRAQLVSHHWLNAHLRDLPAMDPEIYGFDLVDGKYYPKWHEGDVVPPSIETVTKSNDVDADDDNEEEEEEEEEDYDIEDDENDEDDEH